MRGLTILEVISWEKLSVAVLNTVFDAIEREGNMSYTTEEEVITSYMTEREGIMSIPTEGEGF